MGRREWPTCPTCRRPARSGSTSRAFATAAGSVCSGGLPPDIATRLSDEVARIAAQPDIKEKLLMVAQYAHYQSPDDFARQVADDKIFFVRLLKELDIRLE